MSDSIDENYLDVTPAEFESWLKRASPGQSFIYHIGLLAADREEVKMLPAPHSQIAHVIIEPYNTVALIAWNAYERGQIDLVQRRVGPTYQHICQYIAIKRRNQRRRWR